MTTTTGRVIAVNSVEQGSELAMAAAIGATTLYLYDAADFAEDGGHVRIDEVIYSYTGADLDEDTITLAAPLAVALEEDEPVHVWDTVLGEPAVSTTAQVVLDGEDFNDDAMEADVHHALIPFLPEGIRDDMAEDVLLSWDDDTLTIVDILNRVPVFGEDYIPDVEAGNAIHRGETPPWENGDLTHADNDGDLWWDTSEGGSRPYLWDADSQTWVEASDPNIDLTLADLAAKADTNAVEIDDLQGDVEAASDAAYSARNAASTADGRVSISDYEPHPTDSTYYAHDLNGDYLLARETWAITEASLTDGVASLTIETGAIGRSEGELVYITNLGAPYDGLWYINTLDTDVNEVTTLTYLIPNEPDIATATVDGVGQDTVLVPRTEGSIWLTRTRDRQNLVNNPSFESGVDGWWTFRATAVQYDVVAEDEVSGDYALEVTNGSIGPGWAAWDVLTEVWPGQTLAFSGYVRLVSGSGVGLYGHVEFRDAADQTVAIEDSPAITAVTDEWRRVSFTATVPDGATHVAGPFFVNPHPFDVWYLDGVLMEYAEETGRYFDGHSFGAEWLGEPDNSVSQMVGGMVTNVWELHDSGWSRLQWTSETMESLSASDITHGTLNGGLLGDNTIAVDKMMTNAVIASEGLTAGDLVNVWDFDGLFMVRRADAAEGYEAHGFVLNTVDTGSPVLVYTEGYNPLLGDLSPGTQFLSTTPGRCSGTPPSKPDRTVQRVGFASDETTLHFAPQVPIRLK